jgi:hypothetical protein
MQQYQIFTGLIQRKNNGPNADNCGKCGAPFGFEFFLFLLVNENTSSIYQKI